MITFSKVRYQSRLYGFCWAILETRDKEFNAEQLKEQNLGITVMQALNYATQEEHEAITQLIDIIKVKNDIDDERAAILGALEGKKVVYSKLDPLKLLLDKDVFSKDEISSIFNKGSKKNYYILGGLFAIILCVIISNLPFVKEYRAYRDVVKSHTLSGCDSYLEQYGTTAKHSADVFYLKVKYSYYNMPVMADFLSTFPNDEHFTEIKKKYDSIWREEIAKYQNSDKLEYSPEAEKYMTELLTYLQNNYNNEVVVDVDIDLHLKEYSEYDESMRSLVEYFYKDEEMSITEGMVSLKNNFSTSNQVQLTSILVRGVQKSFDRIFTPNFIRVVASSNSQKSPNLYFYCNIHTQENLLGVPEIWIYQEVETKHILGYLMGISIDFAATFSIPNSDIVYDYKEIGEPENAIHGIQDIKSGYLQMSAMCFAEFSNKMSRNLGLKESYFTEE